MYQLIKNLLFKLPPELVHDLTIDILSASNRLAILKMFSKPPPVQPVELMGLKFINPIGLAAGMDKNAEAVNAFFTMGFGFVEVGTVTPLPQLGNPKPRLFRLPKDNALINRMGFNNKGVDYLVSKLKTIKRQGILGINIGKGINTHLENASDDYIQCMEKVYCHADYITINLSSPNTPGLRELQFGDHLKNLLGRIKEKQHHLQKNHNKYVPLLVKLAPDLTEKEVSNIAEQLLNEEIDGVIATNTSTDHALVQQSQHSHETGGISGGPLSEVSCKIIRQLKASLNDKIAIIGVGGIIDSQTSTDKVDAGASLLQLYTGLIYQGPQLVQEASSGFYNSKPVQP